MVENASPFRAGRPRSLIRRGAPTGQLSPTVSAALEAVGARAVLPAELIDGILRRHPNDYLSGSSVREAWLTRDQEAEQANGIRQPAAQWQTELQRLVVPGQEIFGRIAIVALALTDQTVAQAAQISGLLEAQIAEIHPDAVSLLTDFGLAMLRKRAPIVAFGRGAFDPTVELKLLSSHSTALVAVARQDGVPNAQVGRWALGVGNEVYSGLGGTLSIVDGLRAPIALGWHGGNELLAFRNVGDAGEVIRAHVSTGSQAIVDPGEPQKWPVASKAVQGASGTAIVSSAGELLWGDPSAISADDSLRGWTAVTMERSESMPVRVAGLNDRHQLSAYSFDTGASPWTIGVASGTNAVLVAAGATHVFAAAPDSASPAAMSVTVVPWTGNQAELRIVRPIPGHPQHLSAGGRYAAISDGRAVTVMSPAAVVARREFAANVIGMDLSPDGEVLAVVCADQTLRMWRLTPVDDLSLSSYDNDNPDGPDLLGVSPTVDALAALICAKVIAPPLSVGLFGAWGSGKSFFMRKLQARVDEVVEDAQQSGRVQRSLWAWRNISQVRFNAWDYSSGDVWAGLLEKLIHELASPQNGQLTLPAELDAMKKRRLERMVASQAVLREVSAARDEAQTDLGKAEQELADARRDLEQRQQAIDDAVKQAENRAAGDALRELVTKALAPVGGGEAAEALEEVDAQLRAARQRLQSLQGLIRAQNSGRWIVGALILGPLVGVGLAALLHSFQPSLSGVAAIVGTVTTLLVGVARWVKVGVSWIDAQLKPIEAAERQAAKAHAALITEVENAEAAHATAAAKLTVAQSTVADSQHKLVDAERAVADSTAGSLLNEYLTARSTSADYRNLLGVIGMVRSDLETISGAVAQHNALVLSEEYIGTDDVVNRIVLYIDDLDRCRPDVVVKVLEAVHLLLSYPLFVVIVAVDAQWVSRSLASVYPTLLTGGDVTPDQYLEKIFQLPMWLESPSVDAAQQMLSGILRPGPRPGAAARPPVQTAPPDSQIGESLPARTSAGQVVTSGADFATSTPKELELTPEEDADITALGGLVSRSPRAIKRFINTYHLLKVIEGDPTELERVRVLLAIAVGRPPLGERLLSVILSNPVPARTLTEILEEQSVDDRAWLQEGIASRQGTWARMTSDNSVRAARHVHRFVYRTTEATDPAGSLASETP